LVAKWLKYYEKFVQLFDWEGLSDKEYLNKRKQYSVARVNDTYPLIEKHLLQVLPEKILKRFF
jgi:hypothetical protein